MSQPFSALHWQGVNQHGCDLWSSNLKNYFLLPKIILTELPYMKPPNKDVCKCSKYRLFTTVHRGRLGLSPHKAWTKIGHLQVSLQNWPPHPGWAIRMWWLKLVESIEQISHRTSRGPNRRRCTQSNTQIIRENILSQHNWICIQQSFPVYNTTCTSTDKIEIVSGEAVY